MQPSDFDSIMAALSDSQRAKVVGLLQELDNNPANEALADNSTDYKPLVVPENLSAWLVARVNGNPAAGDEVVEQFAMTATATAALRDCAAELTPQPEQMFPRPSLLDRLSYFMSGKQTA
jgi:hypothetical protein